MSETDSTHAEAARLLPPPPAPAPASPPGSESAAASPAPHRLYRDPNTLLGGVASGLAAYFDIDPVIVRLLWIVALLTGLGAPAYLVCWVVVPKAETWPPPGYPSSSLPGARSGDTASLTSGLVIVGLAALVGSGEAGVRDLFLPAALLGFGVYLLNQRAAGQQGVALPSAAPSGMPRSASVSAASVPAGASPPVDRVSAARGAANQPAAPRGLVTPTVLSLLALGAGVCWALGAAGVVELSLARVAAGGLVLVGGGLIASLWFGRAPGLVVVGLGLALLLLLASRLEPWFHRGGTTYAHVGQGTLEPSLVQGHGRHVSAVGKHVYQPRSLDELVSEYALGMGELTLDLSQLDFSGTTRAVQVQVGTGQAVVIVPPDTRVEAHGRAGLGDVRALERRDGGFGSTVEARSEGNGAGTLLIDFGVGIGEGTVRRGL